MKILHRAGRRRLFVLCLAAFGLLSPFAQFSASASSFLTAEVFENQTLNLSAPDGSSFTSVHFASYGTPVQENGEWVASSCHAVNSLSVVEETAIGQQTFSIEANNSIFGDPCGGTVKRLVVVAEYAPNEPATTTTTLPPTNPGLIYWTFVSQGSSPIEPGDTTNSLSSGVVQEINHDWGGGQILDSGRNDGVIAWFDGFIHPGDLLSHTFYLCSDDGMRLYLDGELVLDNWWDRGPSCGPVGYEADFSDGQPKSIRVSWYENGGGASAYLRYLDGDGFLNNVPSSWFFHGSSPEPTATTTTTTTTTLPPNFLGAPTAVSVTETAEGLLVSWTPSTIDVGVSPERYFITWFIGESSWGITTGNAGDLNALNTSILLDYQLFETTGGLDVEYSFAVRADNDSAGIYSQASDPVIMAAPAPTTTTTTTTAATQTTTTTLAPIVSPEPPIIDESDDTGGSDLDDSPVEEPEKPVDEQPADSSPPEEQVPKPTPDGENEESTPEAPIEEPSEPQEPDLPEEPSEPEESTDPEDSSGTEEPEDFTEDITPEKAQELVEELLSNGLDPEGAADIASSATALQVLTSDQASEVFKTLEIEELNHEQVAEIVAAVQGATEEVRQAFEEEINVFSGGALDNYVPLGSVISVGERRVVIAATGVILAGASVSAPSGSGSSSQGESRRRGSK